MSQQKLSIRDIPTVNDRITAQVAKQHKVSEAKVTELVNFVGSYIADVMRTGGMETVMLPYLGKFKPKAKLVHALNKIKLNERNGKDLIFRAMNGKAVIDKRPKPDTDETI